MVQQERILRYPETREVGSQQDVFSDVISWLRGLQSKGFVTDVLAAHHGFTHGSSTRVAARAVAAHVRLALDFLDQAFSGSPELSFLPIYYSLANLAKAMIIAGHRIGDISSQRLHGVSWSGVATSSRHLINDHITLMSRGTIPLFYQVITGTMWPNTPQKRRDSTWTLSPRRVVYLRDIYPFIYSVGHEYKQIIGQPVRLETVQVFAKTVGPNSARIEIHLDPGSRVASGRTAKLLAGFRREGKMFVSRTETTSSAEESIRTLSGTLRRYLLYDTISTSGCIHADPHMGRIPVVISVTPFSSSNLLLPEELPILLAFFHLSSVVRYDPQRLIRLFDSRSASLLHSLRRHGTYRFLLLFWSYINHANYFIM